jgi:hypothetical protein
MHGELVLQLNTVLGDYAALGGSMGFHVTVVISPGASGGPSPRPATSLSRVGSSPTSPSNPPQPVLVSSPPFSPPGQASNSYLILVVLEDGRSMQPVVWGTMQVRRLCQLVGEFARVPPDTVFIQYAGGVLDVEHCMQDPPAIRAGARVYAFFSIARALQFVVNLMQGGIGGSPPHHPPPRRCLDPREARAFRTHLFRGIAP